MLHFENEKTTTPYKKLPTYCLKMKIERIDELTEKLTDRTLNDEDYNHIRAILREMQYCIENLYEERSNNG